MAATRARECECLHALRPCGALRGLGAARAAGWPCAARDGRAVAVARLSHSTGIPRTRLASGWALHPLIRLLILGLDFVIGGGPFIGAAI